MQYEFRANTLIGAVQKSLAKSPGRLQRKSSTTINTDVGSYNRETLSHYVQEGRRYSISWDAHDEAEDGSSYGIDIQSFDGHGTHREGFSSSGSWDFIANFTGEVQFTVGVSRDFGSIWGSYPIEISID